MNEEENSHDENNSEVKVNYNFKWMIILLLIGIVGSFIFASFMKQY